MGTEEMAVQILSLTRENNHPSSGVISGLTLTRRVGGESHSWEEPLFPPTVTQHSVCSQQRTKQRGTGDRGQMLTQVLARTTGQPEPSSKMLPSLCAQSAVSFVSATASEWNTQVWLYEQLQEQQQ